MQTLCPVDRVYGNRAVARRLASWVDRLIFQRLPQKLNFLNWSTWSCSGVEERERNRGDQPLLYTVANWKRFLCKSIHFIFGESISICLFVHLINTEVVGHPQQEKSINPLVSKNSNSVQLIPYFRRSRNTNRPFCNYPDPKEGWMDHYNGNAKRLISNLISKILATKRYNTINIEVAHTWKVEMCSTNLKSPLKLIPFGLHFQVEREIHNSVSHSDTMRFDFIIHVGGNKKPQNIVEYVHGAETGYLWTGFQ